jgi:hypothetical protein
MDFSDQREPLSQIVPSISCFPLIEGDVNIEIWKKVQILKVSFKIPQKFPFITDSSEPLIRGKIKENKYVYMPCESFKWNQLDQAILRNSPPKMNHGTAPPTCAFPT